MASGSRSICRRRSRPTATTTTTSSVPTSEDHFRAGLELFNRGEFFEAHEAMEDAMNSLGDDSPDWNFYLGLLRAAVANHKLADGEKQSAVFHLRAALKFLAPYSDSHHGVRLAEFRTGLKAQLAALLTNASPPPPPRIKG